MFYGSGYGLSCYLFNGQLKIMYICCCWVECSTNVDSILLDNGVDFFYILGDFLNLDVLLVVESMLNFPTIILVLSIFFKFYQFWTYVFLQLCLVTYSCYCCLKCGLTLFSLYNILLSQVIFAVKSTLSDINLVTSTFFFLMYFFVFSFNMTISLYLKCISLDSIV